MQARRRSVFAASAVALSLVTTTVPADPVEAEGETYLTLTPSERADFEAVSTFLLEGGRAADLPVRNLIGTMQQGSTTRRCRLHAAFRSTRSPNRRAVRPTRWCRRC